MTEQSLKEGWRCGGRRTESLSEGGQRPPGEPLTGIRRWPTGAISGGKEQEVACVGWKIKMKRNGDFRREARVSGDSSETVPTEMEQHFQFEVGK
uniref:Uncharacterized protein n=1 Tax=Knipowitschia caucasica TaxID=637954 RepID=A0AAV2M6U9_KNICA